MMQTLHPEQPRCHGWDCPLRESCLRYAERSQHNQTTVFVVHLCKEPRRERFIPYTGTGKRFPWDLTKGV